MNCDYGRRRRVHLRPRTWILRLGRYRKITGDWLMRGRFPVVYPTGPSKEGSAESEPSYFLPLSAQLLASEHSSR